MTVTREPAPAKSGQLTDGQGAAEAAARWPAAQQAGRPGVAACWLCSTRRSITLMVADGGVACPDIRWYCQDTERCTWRWTTKNGSVTDGPAPRELGPAIGLSQVPGG